MLVYCSYFPRSGGNYLVKNYSEHIKKVVQHSHDVNVLSKPHSFSIIRNPENALSSMALLSLSKVVTNFPDSFNNDTDKVLFLARTMEQYANDYISFYTNENIERVPVCDFDEVVSDVVSVCTKLGDLFGHKSYHFNPTPARSREDFTATSRDSEYVGLLDAAVDGVDLSAALKVYHKVLETTI